MKNAAIGVFDSGVGGLSVLREIRKLLPREDLFYVADSGAGPYGDQSGEFIQERVHALADFLLEKKVKSLVVACNTATTVAIQSLRMRLSLPIIAIEPAVKPAVELTRSGIVGILATSRTLTSRRFQCLVEDYGNGTKILLQPCPGLMEQVEKGELESVKTYELTARYLSPLLEKGADTIVLGCTHYPFLLPVIRKFTGPDVSIIDPAVAVARQVYRRLEACDLLSSRQTPGVERFWTSGLLPCVKPLITQIWDKKVALCSLSLCPQP
ncbi:MAG: glutamate racemase [Deltaproteobacteria bacterium]|nr:glutamate racemase [Deltaproteobacteria bacterium]